MTDREWLLSVLADGRPHTLAYLLARSMNERGCGLTVHSRVAEARKLGYVIEHARVPGEERGHGHTYTLVSSPELAALPLSPAASSEGEPGSCNPRVSPPAEGERRASNARDREPGSPDFFEERHGAQRDAATARDPATETPPLEQLSLEDAA